MDLRIKLLHELLIEKQWKLSHAKDGDAGMDLVSVETITIPPGEHRLVKTGVALEIPFGFFGKIEGRSGLAKNYGIDVLGGIIDRTFRGEICALLMNNGKIGFEIKPMDRIAQILILPYASCEVQIVPGLTPTTRGENGFGSTGMN